MAGSSSQEETFDTEKYWQKRLSETYNLGGVGYAGLSRSYNQWLYRVRRHNFHRVVRNYDLGESLRVLDIGSGTGFYIDLWEEAGAREVVGIDIAEVAVQKLRSRYPNHTFLRRDITESLPSKTEEKFGAASAMDVLFHIVDDRKYRRALSNVYDRLRPGGFLFFTGNFLHTETRRSQHIVHRSLDEIRQVVEETGFEIVDRQPVFVVMNEPVDSPPALIRHLWPKIFRIASHSEAAGQFLGSVLFALEVPLTRMLGESPTTEIMVCRKP
jgi:SAM-dependent methyltransferase